MLRRAIPVLVLSGMVLLAGCAGGTSGSSASPSSRSPAGPANGASTPGATDTGTVAFYVSDEENDVGDFTHLNVTVSRVGFERAGGNGSGGWVEREVDDVTVDLTELQGEKAALVDAYELPNGTYQKVFVHVSAANGTLATGEDVRVKLPSEKLQLAKPFTVGGGSEVAFVFDITVHEAGNSGKYVLQPVVGESGTDVPIEPTDDGRNDGDERDDGASGDSDSLEATFRGPVSAGENATLSVTRDGDPVEGAVVSVDGEAVGRTDADGESTIAVPDAETLSVTVEVGDDEVEIEREIAGRTPSEPEA